MHPKPPHSRPVGRDDFRRQVAELLRATAAEFGDPIVKDWVGKLTSEDMKEKRNRPRKARKK